jgi:hypothetical protein
MALPVGSATSRNGYEELQYANPCCTPRPQIPAKASRARETIWYRSRTWSSRWVSYKLKSENTIERPWGGVRWWVYGGRVACGVCRRGYGRSLRWWPWILVRKEERESEQGEERKVNKWEKAGNKTKMIKYSISCTPLRLWIYITYIYILKQHPEWGEKLSFFPLWERKPFVWVCRRGRVASRLPPPGKCFLLALSGYEWFLLLHGVYQWRLGFLPAIWVVEFCSPR